MLLRLFDINDSEYLISANAFLSPNVYINVLSLSFLLKKKLNCNLYYQRNATYAGTSDCYRAGGCEEEDRLTGDFFSNDSIKRTAHKPHTHYHTIEKERNCQWETVSTAKACRNRFLTNIYNIIFTQFIKLFNVEFDSEIHFVLTDVIFFCLSSIICFVEFSVTINVKSDCFTFENNLLLRKNGGATSRCCADVYYSILVYFLHCRRLKVRNFVVLQIYKML